MTIENALTVDRWLYGLMTNDATLSGMIDDRVFQDIAPASAAHPLVVMVAPAEDYVTRGAGPVNIMFTGDWALRATGLDTFDDIEPVVARIYELVHGASGAVSSGVVVGATVEGRIRYTETTEGKTYRHLGLIVRVLSQ